MKIISDNRETLEQAKTHLPEYLRSIGLEPSKNMHCLHHHPDNPPSMSLLPDHTHVYCHACGWQADLINVIAEVEHLEPNSKEAINRALEFAGIETVKQCQPNKNATQTRHTPTWTPALKSTVL